MPYILPVTREVLNDAGLDALTDLHMNEGDLNYTLTVLLHRYVDNNGLRYRTLNAVMGILESCKQEFYRRVVAPYEDLKIQENGDV